MTGRRLWLIAALWLITVAGASTVTWTVISAAGARVSQPITVAAPVASQPVGSAAADAGRTWTGRGGRVTALCSGDDISLGVAIPNVGYWVKVYDPGPKLLRVDFESTDSDDHGEVRLGASCRNGTPEFTRL